MYMNFLYKLINAWQTGIRFQVYDRTNITHLSADMFTAPHVSCLTNFWFIERVCICPDIIGLGYGTYAPQV